MARIADGRKRKRKISVSTDTHIPPPSERNGDHQQTAILVEKTQRTTEGNTPGEGDVQPQIKESPGKNMHVNQVQVVDNQSPTQADGFAKTDPNKKRKLGRPRAPRVFDRDKECSRQLEKLKSLVDKCGGKLEDGWHVVSRQRFKAGTWFYTFLSPTKEKFRSRLEVARHLGLCAQDLKLGQAHSVSNGNLALVPFDHMKVRSVKATVYRRAGKKLLKGRKQYDRLKPSFVLKTKAVEDINDLQVIKTMGVPSSTITDRCQSILRSIISTESFAALSNMVNCGLLPTSGDTTLPSSFLTGSLADLQLIHVRLSTGAYGQTPELFSTDIQQVWNNIISVGNKLTSLASSLSELSNNLYKHQVMSLFDEPSMNNVSPSVKWSFEDTQRESEVHLPKSMAIRPASPLGGKNVKTFVRARKKILSKKVPVTSRQLLVEKSPTNYGQGKEPLASSSTESMVCRTCGLEKYGEMVVCKQCDARYHIHCAGYVPSASGWYCPPCLSNRLIDVAADELGKDLSLIATAKMAVCEVCKKEDDNVLLCDGCDTAYHMSCLSPPIDSIPDGFWYCSICSEAERKAVASLPNQDTDGDHANCAVCERVSNMALAGEYESSAQVPSKEMSPVYSVPEQSVEEGGNGYQEHSLNQDTWEDGADEGKSAEHVYCADEGKSVEHAYYLDDSCKLCGIDQEGMRVISCTACDRRYHWACLKPPIKKTPRKIWYCPSCLCRTCKIDKDDNKIILCDGCDEGYHMYCLVPPIVEVPQGQWFCASCEKAKSDAMMPASSPSRAEALKKKRKSNEPKRSL